MPKFPERLKLLRTSRELSQYSLANYIGISKSSINMYERGEREPGIETLEAIADFFNVDMNYLIGKSDVPNSYVLAQTIPAHAIPSASNILPLPAMREWPVLGATACGEPLHKALEGETIMAPIDIKADFVFRCVGDSMIGARILDGDTVFVQFANVDDGDIAVVRIGDEYTLKRIYRGPDYLELVSENPAYPPRRISGDQMDAEIIGKAVYFVGRVI